MVKINRKIKKLRGGEYAYGRMVSPCFDDDLRVFRLLPPPVFGLIRIKNKIFNFPLAFHKI